MARHGSHVPGGVFRRGDESAASQGCGWEVPCAPSPIVSLSAVVENGDGVSLDQQKVLAQKSGERKGEEEEEEERGV